MFDVPFGVFFTTLNRERRIMKDGLNVPLLDVISKRQKCFSRNFELLTRFAQEFHSIFGIPAWHPVLPTRADFYCTLIIRFFSFHSKQKTHRIKRSDEN
jgi:hypothetical protein